MRKGDFQGNAYGRQPTQRNGKQNNSSLFGFSVGAAVAVTAAFGFRLALPFAKSFRSLTILLYFSGGILLNFSGGMSKSKKRLALQGSRGKMEGRLKSFT